MTLGTGARVAAMMIAAVALAWTPGAPAMAASASSAVSAVSAVSASTAATVVSARPSAEPADPQSYASSAATRYQVTLAARVCDSYAQVMANQVRDDTAEALSRPGRDSAYQPGQPVDPGVEEANDDGCPELTGWRFTFGSGRGRKGMLSVVSGAVLTTPSTAAWTARLDATGKDSGGLLGGAVTVGLTDEQVRLAGRRQLWVQGGTPDDPLTEGYRFGALRCAVDGRTGGNTQWLGFGSGVRHVFCFAYYVKGAAAAGTVTVRMRPRRPVGYPQKVAFQSDLSLAPEGRFTLASSGNPVETTLTRMGRAEPYSVIAQPPSGWRVADVSCVASRSGGGAATSRTSVEPAAGRASITLAAGDLVTCTYLIEAPAAMPGLTVRVHSDGAPTPFGVTVDGAGGPRVLTVAPVADGSAAAATGADLTRLAAGTYSVTVRPPSAEAGSWTLVAASCNGTVVPVTAMTIGATLVSGVPQECVLRLSRTPRALRLNVVTSGGVASAAFAVAPAADAGVGWWAAANTTGYGVRAAAAGDLPQQLPSGTYLVTAIAPRSSAEGAWNLTAFTCDPGDETTPAPGSVGITVSPGAPDPVCTASYQLVPATRLQVALRALGSVDGRIGPSIVELSCVDGSVGRVVLGPRDSDQRDLPDALAFLEPTSCLISQPATGAAAGSDVDASATLEPAPPESRLTLPARIEVQREVTAYTFVVTNHFSAPADEPGGTSLLGPFQLVPIVLAGVGMITLGAVVFLAVLLRRRMA